MCSPGPASRCRAVELGPVLRARHRQTSNLVVSALWQISKCDFLLIRCHTMALVLCTGRDAILTETRLLILEADGHTAVSAEDESTLVDACRKFAFEVAVIGQAASEQEKQRFFSLIRAKHPGCKILELHSSASTPILRNADGWRSRPSHPASSPNTWRRWQRKAKLPSQEELTKNSRRSTSCQTASRYMKTAFLIRLSRERSGPGQKAALRGWNKVPEDSLLRRCLPAPVPKVPNPACW